MEPNIVDKIINGLIDQGVMGIICVALGAYVIYISRMYQAEKKAIMDSHKEERKDWKEIANRSVDASKETSGIMASLKTLLETTRERK